MKHTRTLRYCSDSEVIWILHDKCEVYVCQEFPWITVWPFSGWEKMKTKGKQFLDILAYRR